VNWTKTGLDHDTCSVLRTAVTITTAILYCSLKPRAFAKV